ncbi:hypothetical protein CROQUDRAFT_108316 [Cronartium quercuum f. sp. fusiforme G11]|uniref:Uncharacterized protein n=1 Tax=Cronartium quercuum f. sp. fusiforme G11 TaxID=708437 RepID=A0A9P6NJI9_9BASI|nr:hypothetical protein CROQUDRAFT_108316 [Cronartium quercuum f. sp. fusiforme G11]
MLETIWSVPLFCILNRFSSLDSTRGIVSSVKGWDGMGWDVCVRFRTNCIWLYQTSQSPTSTSESTRYRHDQLTYIHHGTSYGASDSHLTQRSFDVNRPTSALCELPQGLFCVRWTAFPNIRIPSRVSCSLAVLPIVVPISSSQSLIHLPKYPLGNFGNTLGQPTTLPRSLIVPLFQHCIPYRLWITRTSSPMSSSPGPPLLKLYSLRSCRTHYLVGYMQTPSRSQHVKLLPWCRR